MRITKEEKTVAVLVGWASIGEDRVVMDPALTRRLARECEVEFYRGSGPGGQHRNKVETGVRLFHIPTGLKSQASERRSREQNRTMAFERLAAKIEARNAKRTPRVATRKPAAARESEISGKKHVAKKKRLRRTTIEEI